MREESLTFNSTLPPKVEKLTLGVQYLGTSMEFAVMENGVAVTMVRSGPISPVLEVVTDEGVYALKRGKTVALETKAGVVRKRVSKVQFYDKAASSQCMIRPSICLPVQA